MSELTIADEVRLGDAPGQGQVTHCNADVFEITVPVRITDGYLYDDLCVVP